MSSIKSGASADLLTIDPVSKAGRATQYAPDGTPATVTAGSDPTTVAGGALLGVTNRKVVPFRLDTLGNLTASAPLFADSFEGTTVNPLRWSVTAATMAATQSSVAGLVVNSGSITTINTGYMLQSASRFLKTLRSPLQYKSRARLAAVSNSVMELGFGDAATFNGANTTGAYWRVTSAGQLLPVVTFNGSDVTGSAVGFSTSNYYNFEVVVDDDRATFLVQDSTTGLVISKQEIALALTAQRLLSSTQLAVIERLYNSGTAPASAPQLIVTDVWAGALETERNKAWADTMAALGRSSASHPLTGAQAAQWANSAEPSSAALSNTAASYATLGGKFQFAAVAGAATDYALFAFQAPAPTNLVVTGLSVDTWITGASVATTSTLLTWAAGVSSTAVSLATSGLVRVPLGAQSFARGAEPGSTAEQVRKEFRTPLVVPAGRYLHIILRLPVGTATASQVIAGMVNVEGYFE